MNTLQHREKVVDVYTVDSVKSGQLLAMELIAIFEARQHFFRKNFQGGAKPFSGGGRNAPPPP